MQQKMRSRSWVRVADTQETTELLLPGSGRKHALIIEDEELIAASIEDALRELGFTSFGVARTEQEAVFFADHQEPDLVTVDETLEEGSGVDAILCICASRPIPVIVITGNPFGITLPGVVTLGKPFNAAAFSAAYEQARAKPFHSRSAAMSHAGPQSSE